MFYMELSVLDTTSIQIYSDNQSCIHLSRNPVDHSRSKHIDIRHHFIRDAVRQGKIKLTYVSTHDTAADMLTKALGREKLQHCMILSGLHKIFVHFGGEV